MFFWRLGETGSSGCGRGARLWKQGCLVLLLVGLLTACGRPLVTSRRTPGAVRTGTTTVVAGAATPAAATNAPSEVAVAQPEPTSPPEVASHQPPIESPSVAAVVPSETEQASVATAAPVAPSPARVVIIPATEVPISNNDRWRQQEVNRQPLPQPQIYTTLGSDLFWYDPIYRQSVSLGRFSGSFEVLATFELRGTDQPALEVLYEVNKRYGLTALSPALVERIRAAGYESGVIDTYVLNDDNVRPK